MTIGLANSAKRARFSGETTNENQGGGSKKAGLPYQVGRNWHFLSFMTEHESANTLSVLRVTRNRANLSRPVGSWTNGNTYWRIPGTGNP
jgi:hypothetical protein